MDHPLKALYPVFWELIAHTEQNNSSIYRKLKGFLQRAEIGIPPRRLNVAGVIPAASSHPCHFTPESMTGWEPQMDGTPEEYEQFMAPILQIIELYGGAPAAT